MKNISTMVVLACAIAATFPTAHAVASINAKVPVPVQDAIAFEVAMTGKASYYGCCNRHTASGDVFNKNHMAAAMRPETMKKHGIKYGDYVTVKNTKNGKTVTVKINDRLGHKGRIIDLTEGAMRALGGISAGVIPVEIQVH